MLAPGLQRAAVLQPLPLVIFLTAARPPGLGPPTPSTQDYILLTPIYLTNSLSISRVISSEGLPRWWHRAPFVSSTSHSSILHANLDVRGKPLEALSSAK